MYVSLKWVNIGSGKGFSPGRRQDITWTNADSLSIGHLAKNFSEIWIKMKKSFYSRKRVAEYRLRHGRHFIQG